MTTATFHPSRLYGTASVPPAKSEAHRALLLAALGKGCCRLHGFPPPLCEDTQAMLNGLAAMGAKVSHEGEVLVVEPAPPVLETDEVKTFHVNACAAALRMLIPAFWARGQAVRITMEPGLFARPLDAFVPLAEQIGGRMALSPAMAGKPAVVEISGKLDAGEYQVDGTVSSQFASGLLIALSCATDASGKPSPSRLTLTKPIVSRPYLDMTLIQMERFGAPCPETEEGVFAISSDGRKNPVKAAVGGDWSQAAVLLCANALGSGTMVHGLELPKAGELPLQGDSEILEILRQMGLFVSQMGEDLYVTNPSRSGLMPLLLDCTAIPDIAPILALTCSQACGKSTLTGVKRLRVKECDRLSATEDLLVQMGVSVSVSADSDVLIIEGQGKQGEESRLKGGFTADARGDHRMVMLLATAALIADKPITVRGIEALDKSWPGFMETYRALGGVVS